MSLPCQPGKRSTSVCSPRCPTNSSSWAPLAPQCIKPSTKISYIFWYLKSCLISASHLSLTTRGWRRRHRANCSWKKEDNHGLMYYCGLATDMSENVCPIQQFYIWVMLAIGDTHRFCLQKKTGCTIFTDWPISVICWCRDKSSASIRAIGAPLKVLTGV